MSRKGKQIEREKKKHSKKKQRTKGKRLEQILIPQDEEDEEDAIEEETGLGVKETMRNLRRGFMSENDALKEEGMIYQC